MTIYSILVDTFVGQNESCMFEKEKKEKKKKKEKIVNEMKRFFQYG